MAFDPVTYAAAVSAAKRYHDEHSGGSAIMVGTVTNGSTFPTVRPSGEALIIGDFVKPASGSTFPFTVGGITFATTSDQAVYDGNGGWMYNANPFQSTADTPVKSVATESVSGTAATQQAVNIENKAEFAKKIDKNLGSENHDKILAVGADGNVVTRYPSNILAIPTRTAPAFSGWYYIVDEDSLEAYIAD